MSLISIGCSIKIRFTENDLFILVIQGNKAWKFDAASLTVAGAGL